MISPHPPKLRMNRRKTVSVTPAMGASTVAGEIVTEPIWSERGTRACLETVEPSESAGLSQNFFTFVL
jgi:hypothetical protein